MKAENPTLFSTVKQMQSSLSNWKTQALKYKDQLQHGYDLDKKLQGKFTQRLDALSLKYHQRLSDLQGVLNQMVTLAQKAHDEGSAISTALSTAHSQLDAVDSSISELESDIERLDSYSHIAVRVDAIFQPLKWILIHTKCTGDKNNCKSMCLTYFDVIVKGNPNNNNSLIAISVPLCR